MFFLSMFFGRIEKVDAEWDYSGDTPIWREDSTGTGSTVTDNIDTNVGDGIQGSANDNFYDQNELGDLNGLDTNVETYYNQNELGDLSGLDTSVDNNVCDPACETGEACQNGTCVSTATTTSCDSSPSCWFYNCCAKETEPAASQAEINKAGTEAQAKTLTQEAAAKEALAKDAEMQKACESGATQTPACKAAQDKLTAAKDAYDSAKADADAAREKLAQLSGQTSSGDSSYGNGYMVANGILGGVVDQGSYSSGSYGSYGGGSSSGLSYSSDVLGSSTQGTCGPGFAKVGGVCFPANTGLSSAPISVILSNIFSWLMGLFTTFAVIAFIISGIQYLTSAGDTDQIEKAKNNAMYALLGVIVGLSGFVIVKAIAAAISGQSYFF